MDAEGLIEKSNNGQPLLYATLSASFQLESLTPESSLALSEVSARVAGWFGDRLRWSWSSVHGEVEPYRPDDLELIEGWPQGLRNPCELADPSAQETSSWIASASSDQFGLNVHGATFRNVASPFQYRFFGEMPEPGVGKVFVNQSFLSLSVPIDWPLADFHARVLDIASLLPIRWGTAGLGYGGWEFDAQNDTRAALFAHARRYAGYDVGQGTGNVSDFRERLRTVSWLTFLGPYFVQKLAAMKLEPRPTPLVDVQQGPAGMVLRAGERPDECDLNRLRLAPAYVQADEMIRPLRARSGSDFLDPWTESTTEKWLRRFEKRIY